MVLELKGNKDTLYKCMNCTLKVEHKTLEVQFLYA